MKAKLIFWAAACLAISFLFFNELLAKIPQWLSPIGLQHHGVFHWCVLGLCTLWLWLKREDILPKMQASKLSPPFMLAGLLLVALSILLPRQDNFLVFLMLLGWLGVFIMIFSRAGIMPAILLSIYGFSVAFPIFVTPWLGEPSAVMVTNIVATIMNMLGLPIVSRGLLLQFNSAIGDTISVTVTPGCVGYATIGVFIALFSLMMLDIMLPLRRAWYVFLFGLIGTGLQNIIRIVVSIAAGYYWGTGALEVMHHNLAYVIFPLWYALFAYVYLRQAGWKGISVKRQ